MTRPQQPDPEKIRAFRERQQKLAAAATAASILGLQLVTRELKRQIEGEKPIAIKDLAPLINACARVAESASNAEAVALSVDELLLSLDSDAEHPGHSEETPPKAPGPLRKIKAG